LEDTSLYGFYHLTVRIVAVMLVCSLDRCLFEILSLDDGDWDGQREVEAEYEGLTDIFVCKLMTKTNSLRLMLD
jgi:hypothetical protein